MEEKTNDNQKEDIEIISEDSTGDSKIEKLKRDLAVCRKEKEEYLQGWQRAKADYINLDRASSLRQDSAVSYATDKIFKELLDIADVFEEALKVESNGSAWAAGVKQTYEKILALFKKYEIEAIVTEAKTFDPNLHEAIELAETKEESEDDRIIGEFQKGYTIKGRVLRPAKVKVAHYTQH